MRSEKPPPEEQHQQHNTPHHSEREVLADEGLREGCAARAVSQQPVHASGAARGATSRRAGAAGADTQTALPAADSSVAPQPCWRSCRHVGCRQARPLRCPRLFLARARLSVQVLGAPRVCLGLHRQRAGQLGHTLGAGAARNGQVRDVKAQGVD
jgi:hypothetical protein